MSGAAYFSMLVVWLVAVLPRQRCRRRRTQFLGWKVQSNLSFIFSCFQATNICQEKHMKQATDGSSSSSISLKNWKCVNDNYLFPSSFSLLFFCLSLCLVFTQRVALSHYCSAITIKKLRRLASFFIYSLLYLWTSFCLTSIPLLVTSGQSSWFLMGWRYTANWKTLNLSYARLKSFY